MTPMEFVLLWEGYKSDDSRDPGGRTLFGLSSRCYKSEVDAWWDLPYDEAKGNTIEIYERDYWSKAGCECLPQPLAFVVFNAAVNCGVGRAKRWLIDCRGNWRDFLHLQLCHYAALKKPMFLAGWLNRTLDCWAQARRLEVST